MLSINRSEVKFHGISKYLKSWKKKKKEQKTERERERWYRESEVEDELEGKLAKLFEETVAKDNETWADERQNGCSGVDSCQNTAIVRRETAGETGRHNNVALK